MRAPVSRKIGESTYVVVPFPAGVGIATLTKLVRIVGPAMGKTTSLKDAAAAVFAAIGALAERLDDAAIADILKQLAEHTTLAAGNAKGKAVKLSEVYDEHFSGEYLALFEWAKFALEVNYGPLARALGARVAAPGASADAAA